MTIIDIMERKEHQPTHKRKRLGEEYIHNQRKKMLLGIMDILILQWISQRDK